MESSVIVNWERISSSLVYLMDPSSIAVTTSSHMTNSSSARSSFVMKSKKLLSERGLEIKYMMSFLPSSLSNSLRPMCPRAIGEISEASSPNILPPRPITWILEGSVKLEPADSPSSLPPFLKEKPSLEKELSPRLSLLSTEEISESPKVNISLTSG